MYSLLLFVGLFICMCMSVFVYASLERYKGLVTVVTLVERQGLPGSWGSGRMDLKFIIYPFVPFEFCFMYIYYLF